MGVELLQRTTAESIAADFTNLERVGFRKVSEAVGAFALDPAAADSTLVVDSAADNGSTGDVIAEVCAAPAYEVSDGVSPEP